LQTTLSLISIPVGTANFARNDLAQIQLSSVR